MAIPAGLHLRNKPQFLIGQYTISTTAGTLGQYVKPSALVDLSAWCRAISGTVNNQAPARVITGGSDIIHHLSADRVEYGELQVVFYKSWAASGPDVTLKKIFEDARPCFVGMKDDGPNNPSATAPWLEGVLIPQGGWAPAGSDTEQTEGSVFTTTWIPANTLSNQSAKTVVGDAPSDPYRT